MSRFVSILIFAIVFAPLILSFENCGSGFKPLGLGTLTSNSSLGSPSKMELWYYQSTYLSPGQGPQVIADCKKLIDRAVAAGYTGVVFADSSIQYILTGWSTANEKAVIDYAALKGLKTSVMIGPMGNSGAIAGNGQKEDSVTGHDPNLAEADYVGPTDPAINPGQISSASGTQYVAVSGSSGIQLQIKDSLKPEGLGNGDFEQGPVNGNFNGVVNFSTSDSNIFMTGAASQCHSGSNCVVFVPTQTGANQRLYHPIHLIPHRQYHVRFWVKGIDAQAPGYGPHAILIDTDNSQRSELLGSDFYINDAADPGSRYFTNVNVAGGSYNYDQVNNKWVPYDFTFNSRQTANATLLIGIWGGLSAGQVYFDDISVEETGLVNLVKTAGNPAKVTSANCPTTGCEEGKDYTSFQDSAYLKMFGVLTDFYHNPPTVMIPVGSRIKVGDTVSISYYAVSPFYGAGYTGGWVFANLAEPETNHFNMIQTQAMAKLFPNNVAFFMTYDEIRAMFGGGLARQRYKKAGDELATSATITHDMTVGPNGIHPGNRIFVWSDMFDPYHNAGKNYGHIDGDLAGSWNGLPADVVIMNWHPIEDPDASKNPPVLNDMTTSLKFFAGFEPNRNAIPHQQIIAGYYDAGAGNGCAQATKEMAKAAGVPGVLGMMYTTWQGNYGELESYARCAKAAWQTYRNSLK